MMQKIINFIKYNNAFTIIFVILFFGFGIGFAASPTMRDGVYSTTETVVSIDNNLILSADLDNFNFNLRINSITEDEKNYFVAYSYQTLVIEDGFWQAKQIEKTMTVSKEALEGKDLGLYVAEELGENINYELSYLKKVQNLEREKGELQKVVTVEYSGLIGKLLDPKEKVIEGYSPVIPEPVPEVAATVESNPAAVIVSTPYSEPEPQESPVPEPQPEAGPPAETPPQTEPEPEPETASSTPAATGELESPPAETPPQTEPESEPETETGPLPEPEEMVDEELVQEVVDELLEDQATSTPETETATSTPEEVSEPTQ